MEEARRGYAFRSRLPQDGGQVGPRCGQNPYNGQNCIVVVVQLLPQQSHYYRPDLDASRKCAMERNRAMLRYGQDTLRWEIEAHRSILGGGRLVRNWPINR